jgi:hypothetical protein
VLWWIALRLPCRGAVLTDHQLDRALLAPHKLLARLAANQAARAEPARRRVPLARSRGRCARPRARRIAAPAPIGRAGRTRAALGLPCLLCTAHRRGTPVSPRVRQPQRLGEGGERLGDHPHHCPAHPWVQVVRGQQVQFALPIVKTSWPAAHSNGRTHLQACAPDQAPWTMTNLAISKPPPHELRPPRVPSDRACSRWVPRRSRRLQTAPDGSRRSSG